jgi:hypothetical protein
MPQLRYRRTTTRIIAQNPAVQFEHKRITGQRPMDPPSTLQTFLLSMKVEALVGLTLVTTSSQGSPVTRDNLVAMLPGGAVVWDRYRIVKIEVWGGDTQSGGTPAPDLNLTITPIRDTETTVFTDSGTAGSDRAHICVRPSTLFQQQWLSTAPDNTAQFYLGSTNLLGTTPTSLAVLHVSFEARTKTAQKERF